MLIPVNDFNIAPLNCVRYVPHMLREWRFPILAFFYNFCRSPKGGLATLTTTPSAFVVTQ